VRIEHTGKIRWRAGATLETTCDLDISLFPYDRQSCDIVLHNAVYDATSVDIIPAPKAFQLASLNINGLWLVTGTSFVKNFYEDDGKTWPEIVYTVTLQRLASYYMLNLMLPSVFLALLGLSMYWLPLDSGERISLGVTIMLSYSVNLVLLDGYLPVTSQQQATMGMSEALRLF
jgi:hypothetical protein